MATWLVWMLLSWGMPSLAGAVLYAANRTGLLGGRTPSTTEPTIPRPATVAPGCGRRWQASQLWSLGDVGQALDSRLARPQRRVLLNFYPTA